MRSAPGATVPLLLLLTGLAAGGCSPTSARRGPAAAGDLTAYCEVTSTPGLVSFDGEVATVCAEGACGVARVRGGSLELLPVTGARLGLAASRGRVVVLHDDGRLTILEGRDEVELASWAADVAVEDDGDHVLFVGLRAIEEGLGEQDVEVESGDAVGIAPVRLEASPEMGTRIVRMDLDTAELEELVDDAMAGSPIPLPGSDDILFVGVPGSVAALMRVSPGGAPRQITNRDVADTGQDFVPVPLHETTFSGGRLVYAVADETVDAAEDDLHAGGGALWAVDVETGEAELLGEGRFPVGDEGGVTVTTDQAGDGGCASRYLGEEP
jgi:hypothetical protein